MVKRKRRRVLDKAPAPQPIRSRALDAFSNVLARLGAGTPNLLEGTEYSLQRMSRDFNTLNALYRESWIVRRIIDVIPADMLKNWITITSGLDPDVEKRLCLTLRRTQLIDKLKRGMQWGRLYGGALGVMLVKHQGYDLSQPLQLDWIMPGDFAGLLIFDRWNGVNPSSELIEDITDPDYGFPKYYTVTDPAGGGSVKIHHSRVVRFTGNTLPFWEEIAEMQWGASVIESIFDELRKRDNVSWNIAQLTFMANIRVLKMQDLGQLLAATDNESQAELLRTLEAQNMLLNNMGMQVMDAADGLETHQYTFGGLADCYQQFIMDISGAAEIPVTRLFGRSPSGLNATGESDLQNYYDMIAEKQESYLRPILNKVLPPFIISTLGSLPDDFDFEFDPVAEPTDKERADLAKCGTDNVVAAYNAGLISQRTALKELKQQSERTGVWTNITDEDIERASDSVEPPGEMGGMPEMGMPAPVGAADDGLYAPVCDENTNHDKRGRFTYGKGNTSGGNGSSNHKDLQDIGKHVTMDVNRQMFSKVNRIGNTKKLGYNFDFSLCEKHGCTVESFKIKGDDRVQGYMAYKINNHEYGKALYIENIEAAPFNNGINREYKGISKAMLCHAVDISKANDLNGEIVFKSKTNLIGMYKHLGCTVINNMCSVYAEDADDFLKKHRGK